MLDQALESGLMCSTVRALEDDVAIPFESIALQRLDYFIRGTGLFAGRIDIFDSQQPQAILTARLKITGNGRNERTEMKRAGRRRREPPDVGYRIARLHQVTSLPIPVISIPKLSLCQLTTFLCFEAQCRDWSCFQALETNLFSGFVTEAVGGIVDPAKGGIDLA